MKRNNQKRAFTVIELVIVIAVIAILAAVLIPTYSNLVKKANEATALADAKNLVTEMLANILGGEDDAADIITLSKKGNDIFAYGYSVEAGRILTYKGNPAEGKTFAAVIDELGKNGAISDDTTGTNAEWRNPDSIKKILQELGFDENTTMLYANYKINVALFEKAKEVEPSHTCSAATLTKIDGVAATCTNKGYEECYVCTCGKWYSDADATSELKDGRKEITADPTKHVTGSTWQSDETSHWNVCALCSATLNKVAHTFDGNKCTVCGYTKGAESSSTSGTAATTKDTATTTVKPAETTTTTETTVHKHNYNWVQTKAPTCTEKGIETGTCSCGEKATRDVAANGHKAANAEGKCPTCGEFIGTKATTAEDFLNALTSAGAIRLEGDITISKQETGAAVNGRKYISVEAKYIDLNGHKLTLENGLYFKNDVTLRNGSIDYRAPEIIGVETTSSSAITPLFTLSDKTFTLEKVNVNADMSVKFAYLDSSYKPGIYEMHTMSGSIIAIDNMAEGQKFVIKDSTLTCSGHGIVAKDFVPNIYTKPFTIEVTNSTITTNSSKDDGAAYIGIYIGNPYCTLNITDSTITGERNAVFVRCGKAYIKGSTLNRICPEANAIVGTDGIKYEDYEKIVGIGTEKDVNEGLVQIDGEYYGWKNFAFGDCRFAGPLATLAVGSKNSEEVGCKYKADDAAGAADAVCTLTNTQVNVSGGGTRKIYICGNSDYKAILNYDAACGISETEGFLKQNAEYCKVN